MHFTCNRLVDPLMCCCDCWRIHLAEGLACEGRGAKMTKHERKDQRKRQKPTRAPVSNDNGSYADKVRAAPRAIGRK